jgi:hypothetical protein
MLRAKSMECISLVGMAVGKEKFRADAKQVGSDYFLYISVELLKLICCTCIFMDQDGWFVFICLLLKSLYYRLEINGL